MREPLRIYCHGTPQFTGKYACLNERDFDWWGRRAPVAQTAGARARWWGEEGQHQSSPPPADPTQWLRVEAAVVIATLRRVQPFGMLGVQVDYALMWVDVAGKPEVLDLGRVLADAPALYQLASTPSREMIRLEFDWAARRDLQGKLLRWAREGIWEA